MSAIGCIIYLLLYLLFEMVTATFNALLLGARQGDMWGMCDRGFLVPAALGCDDSIILFVLIKKNTEKNLWQKHVSHIFYVNKNWILAMFQACHMNPDFVENICIVWVTELCIVNVLLYVILYLQ